MIFDTIYEFYYSLFSSGDNGSSFWANGYFELGNGIQIFWFDYISAVVTIATIICGIFALFRILGGVLRLFRV